MRSTIQNKLEEFKISKAKSAFRLVLEATDIFLKEYPNGVKTKEELELGIELIRSLVSASLICGTKEFENDHKLYREFLQKKIKVFKMCIPGEFKDLRGITELLFGMKENELG